MIQRPRPEAGITELRRTVAALVDYVNAERGAAVAETASGGGWGYALGDIGQGRTTPIGINWLRRALVTERRAEPPGMFADPAPAGINVQYKARAIDGGFTTGWLTPRRFHDVNTKGCIPAAVDDPCLIVQFPAGDGTYTPELIVFERSHGAPCPEP